MEDHVICLGLKSKTSMMPKKISMRIISGAPSPSHEAPYRLMRLAKAAVLMALSKPERRKTMPTIRRKDLFIVKKKEMLPHQGRATEKMKNQ